MYLHRRQALLGCSRDACSSSGERARIRSAGIGAIQHGPIWLRDRPSHIDMRPIMHTHGAHTGHTHACACTEMHTNAHKPLHADTHANRNTYTQQAHIHTHACTCTRMHTGSHTHTTDTRAHGTHLSSLATSGASTHRRPWARECTAGVRVHRQGARMHRHDASMRRMSMGVRTYCRQHPLLLKSFATMGARTHRRRSDAPSAKAPQRTASWRRTDRQ